MKIKPIYLIIGAIILIFIMKPNFLGASWSADCSFGTNVIGSNYKDGTWIVLNGIAYGYSTGMVSSGIIISEIDYLDSSFMNKVGTTIDGRDIFENPSNVRFKYIFKEKVWVSAETKYYYHYYHYDRADDDADNADLVCCTDTQWTPLPSTICQGQSFTQTSNCGNTRTVSGTKDCSAPTCTSLKSNFLSAVTTWANNPTSTLKSTALQKLVSWVNQC